MKQKMIRCRKFWVSDIKLRAHVRQEDELWRATHMQESVCLSVCLFVCVCVCVSVCVCACVCVKERERGSVCLMKAGREYE